MSHNWPSFWSIEIERAPSWPTGIRGQAIVYEKTDYANLLEYWASTDSSRQAIVQDGISLTYGELSEMSRHFVEILVSQGVRERGVIAAVLHNGPEFIALLFALLKLKCIFVPFDTAIDDEGLRRQTQDAGVQLVLVDEGCRAKRIMQDVACECVTLESFVNSRKTKRATPLLTVDLHENTAFADEPALIAFTSGSTGSPKGALLASRGLFGCSQNLARRLRLTPEDRVLVPLPFSHMFGFVAGMLTTLVAGACIISMRRYSPSAALHLVEEERVTVHHGVPTMFSRELHELEENQYDISSLRVGIAAGSFVPCRLVSMVEDEMGMVLTSAYGSTETINVSMNDPCDSLGNRQETVGKVFDNIEVRVIDAEGHVLPIGETGELQVRSFAVMKSYLITESQTETGIGRDGWFSTGDMALLDESGYLRILGRRKDIIIRNGNNIVPSSLERIYQNHPEVEEVVVMGFPDEDLGERIVCFVVPGCDSGLNPETLKDYIRGHVPKYSIPDIIEIRDELPKLKSGKIDKQFLRESYVTA